MDGPIMQHIEQGAGRLPARVARVSSLATSKAHGEGSRYFDGWKEHDANPYHPINNSSGIIQMGLAENQLFSCHLICWKAGYLHIRRHRSAPIRTACQRLMKPLSRLSWTRRKKVLKQSDVLAPKRTRKNWTFYEQS